MKKLVWLVITVMAFQFGSNNAYAAKPPKGAVKLTSEQIFISDSSLGQFLCGQVRGWEAGKLVGKGKEFFLPMRVELSKFKKLAKTAANLKKMKNMKAKQKKAKEACAGGPPETVPPVSSPEPTPVGPPADVLPENTAAVTREDVDHLYRRAGLGLAPEEAYNFVGLSTSELVDYFMTYKIEYGIENEAYHWLDENPAAPHAPQSQPTVNGLSMYALRILMKTTNQFHERLALLSLHDRLATSSRAVETNGNQRFLMYNHLNLIRQVGSRDMNYAQLLEEIGEDAVMVRWLTLDRSTRKAPNEDYARELMELFSLDTVNDLGEPNYNNNDIIQVARAFTGWNLAQFGQEWRVIFTPLNFDPDPNKVIFAGTAHEGVVKTGRDVVKHILANHPNAPISLAKWMLREYLREDASPAIVAQLAFLLKENNYNMRPAFAKLLKSAEFYKAENQFTIAKTPVERFVHLARIMDRVGMPYDFAAIRSALANMGCVLTRTETVFGCDKLEELPEGQRLLNSVNMVTSLSNNDGLFNQNAFSYRAFFPTTTPTPDEVIDNMEKLFGVKIPSVRRLAFRDFMNSSMNNSGALVTDLFNPANNTQIRRKMGGLFRVFASMPQVHDLR